MTSVSSSTLMCRKSCSAQMSTNRRVASVPKFSATNRSVAPAIGLLPSPTMASASSTVRARRKSSSEIAVLTSALAWVPDAMRFGRRDDDLAPDGNACELPPAEADRIASGGEAVADVIEEAA